MDDTLALEDLSLAELRGELRSEKESEKRLRKSLTAVKLAVRRARHRAASLSQASRPDNTALSMRRTASH
jgi:hypothetical protein